MTTRTEYAVRYTGYRLGQIKTVIVEPLDAVNRDEAEKSRDSTREWQTATEGELPVDAEVVTRTITTTEWAPVATHSFKVGDRVLYRDWPGWEFVGPDTMTSATIRKGLVKIKWAGVDRNMITYGVDPANLTLDTTQTGGEVA